jgi:hypothetical protein
MNKVAMLINEVAQARNRYTTLISTINETEAQFKPAPDEWNLIDITEHLFWAEHGGILGMWKTLYAIRAGKVARTLDSVHKNLSVEVIIDRTWKAKEQVPAVAAPRMGGTLIFWRESLKSLQTILDAFGNELQDDELRVQAHPHPISGPMDFQQRLEFLRFHIDRHVDQAKRVIHEMKS